MMRHASRGRALSVVGDNFAFKKNSFISSHEATRERDVSPDILKMALAVRRGKVIKDNGADLIPETQKGAGVARGAFTNRGNITALNKSVPPEIVALIFSKGECD
jgi:hypothetical protein